VKMEIKDFLYDWHNNSLIGANHAIYLDKSVIYADNFIFSDNDIGYITFELNNVRVARIFLNTITRVD